MGIARRERAGPGASGDDVRRLVADRRLDELRRLAEDGAPVLRHVRGLLYSGDDLLRERAAEAVGRLAAAGGEPRLRALLSKLLWTLNDESGMSGRGTPEALGRILEAMPDLAAEIAPILVSFLEKEEVALNDEILDAGLLLAMGRLGPGAIRLGPAGIERLRGLLAAPEPRLRGAAAWAAGELLRRELRDEVAALAGDPAPFPLYRDGALATPSVGEVARAVLARLEVPGVTC